MATLKRKILMLLAEKEWNQAKLSEESKVNYGTINAWVNRGTRPQWDNLKKVAKVLQIDPDYLMDDTRDWPPSSPDRIHPPISTVPGSIALTPPEEIAEATDTIPIISYVSAGETPVSYGDAGYPAGHGIDKMRRPEGVTDPHAYALIVKGDSMLPALPEGTVVVAVTNIKAREGDIVICREKQTDKVYIKLLKRDDHTVVLESFNIQEHDPLVFNQGDFYFMHPVVSWNKAKKI